MAVSVCARASGWVLGLAAAAVLLAAGCGGDSDGTAAAPTPAAPTGAASAPAPTPEATATSEPGGARPECVALLRTVTTTITEAGEAGPSLAKTGAVWTRNAATVRTQAAAVGGEVAAAGEQVAVEMEAVGRAGAAGDATGVSEGSLKVLKAAAALGTRCGVTGS